MQEIQIHVNTIYSHVIKIELYQSCQIITLFNNKSQYVFSLTRAILLQTLEMIQKENNVISINISQNPMQCAETLEFYLIMIIFGRLNYAVEFYLLSHLLRTQLSLFSQVGVNNNNTSKSTSTINDICDMKQVLIFAKGLS